MKKWKVVLDTLGYRHEDGHRDFKERHVIATCDVEGEARLIAYALEPHYKTLTDRDYPQSDMYILAVTR